MQTTKPTRFSPKFSIMKETGSAVNLANEQNQIMKLKCRGGPLLRKAK